MSLNILQFTFNDFQENTYLLYDETNECVIFDPGCNNDRERKMLVDKIEALSLQPVRLINTHCHIDHVLGNKFISDKYNLPLESHQGEQVVLEANKMVSKMYGISYDPSPDITSFIEPGSPISFGNTTLEVLYTPGHSPASISFFNKDHQLLIAGDVLFQGSIGRTDLPGGNFETLIASIKSEFFTLGRDVKVYSGHGPSTTIGFEMDNNPFLQ